MREGSDVRTACAMASMDGVAEVNQLSVPVSNPGGWATVMSNLGVVNVGVAGQQLLPDSLCGQRLDPGLGLLTPVNPVIPGISLAALPPSVPADQPVVKEIIHCKSCTLFPQNPNLPPPSRRERPPGCRTVFVGGLPENATEEMIREVFERCGGVTALRRSRKNFCHIRLEEEFMVDLALELSGYRMCIGSSSDRKDWGRIHVDFAQARDDLYDWECRQRLQNRENHHLLRPPSPPPITHYSEHEAAALTDRLKDELRFSEATAVLSSWMEHGEVNRRTSNTFYSMIQSVNGHVRRLMSQKVLYEEQLENAKEIFKNGLLEILTQFEQISSVFTAASRQKSWDHFSKAQRKNIEIWRKQCEELRNAHSEEIMGIRREEEMEMSDEELDDNPCKKIRIQENGGSAPGEENHSLCWQLESFQNFPGRLTEAPSLNQQLQRSIDSMQQQLLTLQEKLRAKEAELERAREEQLLLEGEVLGLRHKLTDGDVVGGTNGDVHEKCLNGCVPSSYLSRDRRSELLRQGIASEKEALLLGIISTFLHVHPFGANLEYLWSYIQRLDSKVSAGDLERLMLRLPSMFRQELSGVGATLEKRWKFCGFDALSSA